MSLCRKTPIICCYSLFWKWKWGQIWIIWVIATILITLTKPISIKKSNILDYIIFRGLTHLRNSHLSFHHQIPTRQTYKSSKDRSYALPTTKLICCCPLLMTASFLEIEDEAISSIFLFQVRDNEEHISNNFIISQKILQGKEFCC